MGEKLTHDLNAEYLEAESEKKHHGQNGELGVKEDQNASVIEASAAAQATRGFRHGQGGKGSYGKLPRGCVQIGDIKKAGQQKACSQRAKRQQDAA
jgi:hypothetical protein